jgi:hypothetical protein
VEVGDDVVRVVQRDVGDVQAERKPGQPADAEHREKRRESIGVLKRIDPPQSEMISDVRITTEGSR